MHRFQLAEAGNTWTPALDALNQKGYRLWLESEGEAPDDVCWRAEKDERHFYASGPLAVIGLVAVWEQFGDDWREQDYPIDWYSRLIEESVNR